MNNKIQIEICSGSVTDCVTANKFPIDRIELNSALELGGLTPSIQTFLLAKKNISKKIICMVRPRTAGFCYNNFEIKTMFYDAETFLKNSADGIVFGFLNPNRTIDTSTTKKMVDLIHSYHAEAVFHKAFDEVLDAEKAIQDLIQCHVDRVLTSGLKPTVLEGIDTITFLQKNYRKQIEILPGCGICAENIKEILERSSVTQFHMTAKSDFYDQGNYVAVDARNIQKVLTQIGIYPEQLQANNITGEDIEMMQKDSYEKQFES